MADNDVLIQIRGDVADINAKLADIKGHIGKVTDETKKLHEQSGGYLSKLKENWIAVTAAIASAMVIIGKAKEYVELGAKALQTEDSFRRVAESAGESADAVVSAMKRASAGTVDDSDLMQRAVKGMMLGLSAESMVKIAEMARLGARVAGTTVGDAIEGITNSISTMMPRALKKYGLALGPEVAVITQAQKAGVEGIDLMALAQMNFNIQIARYGELQEDANEKIQVFKARMQETAELIGKKFIQVLIEGNTILGNFRDAAIEVGNALLPVVNRLAAIIGIKPGMMKGTVDDIGLTGVGFGAEEKTPAGATGKGGDPSKVKTLEEQKKEWLRGIKEQTDAKKNADKIEKDILASLTTVNKEHYDAAIAEIDHWLKVVKLEGINELNVVLDTYDKKTDVLDKWYDDQGRDIALHTKRESEKQAKLTALDAAYSKDWDKLQNERATKAYEVIEFQKKSHSSFVAWQLKQDLDVTAFQRSEGDKRKSISAETWDQILEYEKLTGKKVEEYQRESVDTMLIEYKETLVGGVKSALNEIVYEAQNTGKLVGEAVTRAFNRMTDALTDFVMTGKFNFEDFANSVIRDMVRIMIQAQITGPLASAAGAGLAGLFGGGGGGPGKNYEIGAVGSEYTLSEATYIQTGAWHSGGMGNEPSFYRIVPNLDILPRYHKGIGPGERLSITTDDEMTLTPGQQKAMWQLAQASGGAVAPQQITNETHVHMTINALDSRSVSQALAQHKAEIVGMVNQAYNKLGKRGPLGS